LPRPTPMPRALWPDTSAGRSAAALLPLLLALAGCGGGGQPSSATTSANGNRPTRTSTASPTTTGSQAAPSASHETSPGVVRASTQEVTATMHASSHRPRANKPWPVSFTVAKAGRQAHARVRYEYLFAGQVVAHRSNYGFSGSFHDTFVWPPSAVGYPLTFRAVITSGKATLNLDYRVLVIR
jgi:hypothetical protein